MYISLSEIIYHFGCNVLLNKQLKLIVLYVLLHAELLDFLIILTMS